MDAESPSWDDVLAAVEAEARFADALLHDEPVAAHVAPEMYAAPIVLPPLTEMPGVPEALRGRIEELRSQIDALTAELADVLRDWPSAVGEPSSPRRLAATSTRTAREARPSHYMDRLV